MPPADPDRLLHAVGRRIAELRQGRRLTQEELAEAAEVSIKYLQRVERGTQNLTLRSLVKIANLLKVRPIDLLEPPTSTKSTTGRPRKKNS